MRRVFSAIGVLVVLVIAAAGAFFFLPEGEPAAAASPKQPTGTALIERGRYLAQAADCVACHTAPGGQAYAGGLAFKLPFGTIYAPNITPDKDTGIGTWTDADFVRALHSGVGKGGEMLYPAFPYASYALMSTDDALAIKAYLFSLKPVKAKAPANTISFPYNQRYLMRAWRRLFVPDHRFRMRDGQPADVNTGAYLVEALGHCGECHTPRNMLYGLDNGQKFAGAVTQGWKAYNITSDKQAGIGAWSDDDLASYLAKGYAANHGAAAGNMGEAVDDSLSHLSKPDIRAIIAYLRTVRAKSAEADERVNPDPSAIKTSTAYAPPASEVKASPLGLTMFQSACASCHGWNGEGLEHPQAALLGSRTVNDPHGTNLLQVVLYGANRGVPGEGAAFMPAFGQAYSDVEIAAVSNYVLAHFGGKKSSITPADVAAARKAAP
ncbi:MAG: alcohol dehydrogenase [Rhodospirillales bacterium 20-64-7]|nr:MAG: alcohol dehydrogenase [Rhodospirillales bacterium 20-64-7]HQT76388.1 cytochrome c [Rhodopila sp.]